jgi:SulP family sulfate permease
LLIDLTVGIGVGMVLASFLFMRRMSEVTDVRHITDDLDDGDELEDVDQISTRAVPAGIEVYEIDGPFFFGAAEKFKDVLAEVFRKPKVLIIRMRHVPAIDSTGLNVLRDLIRRTRHDRTLVLISELQSQPLLAMRRSGLLDEIGQDNVVGTIDLALAIGQQDLVGRPTTPINAAGV